MPYFCKCGDSFKSYRLLIEHIGLLNPRWPRKSETDEHAVTTLTQQRVFNCKAE